MTEISAHYEELIEPLAFRTCSKCVSFALGRPLTTAISLGHLVEGEQEITIEVPNLTQIDQTSVTWWANAFSQSKPLNQTLAL